MLNESHIEGIITGQWRYSDVQFLRVAVYPDPGRAARRMDAQGRDVPDYVTLRCEGAHALAATSLREGDRVRATGVLTSREYDIPLDAFVRKARGERGSVEELAALAERAGRALAMPHVLNEILVERLIVVEPSLARQARSGRRRGGRAASGAETAPNESAVAALTGTGSPAQVSDCTLTTA